MATISEEKEQLTKLRIQAERRLKAIRRYRSGALLVTVLSSFAGLACWLLGTATNYIEISLGLAAMFLFISLTRDTSETRAEIASLEGRENTLEALESLSSVLKEDAAYIEQIGQAALSNINAYFQIVMRKYRQGAMLTHSATALSFLLVLVAIAFAYHGEKQIQIAELSGGAGLLTQFLTGVFFVMNKTDSDHLDKYQGKLERLTDIALMFGLIDKVGDPANADKIRADVAQRIVVARF